MDSNLVSLSKRSYEQKTAGRHKISRCSHAASTNFDVTSAASHFYICVVNHELLVYVHQTPKA